MEKHTTVDEYINTFQDPKKSLLSEMRQKIKNWVPDSEEVISYRMPAYKLNGVLVYFGAFKDHIGFFPTGLGVERFKDELSDYKISKGTIQFPLNKPIPYDLVEKIVRFRVQQNLEKKKKNN